MTTPDTFRFFQRIAFDGGLLQSDAPASATPNTLRFYRAEMAATLGREPRNRRDWQQAKAMTRSKAKNAKRCTLRTHRTGR
jgi:hypothetical protein